MLQKGAEYIKVLRSERLSIEDKIESLKKERDQLNNSLKWVVTGAGVTTPIFGLNLFEIFLSLLQPFTFGTSGQWCSSVERTNGTRERDVQRLRSIPNARELEILDSKSTYGRILCGAKFNIQICGFHFSSFAVGIDFQATIRVIQFNRFRC